MLIHNRTTTALVWLSCIALYSCKATPITNNQSEPIFQTLDPAAAHEGRFVNDGFYRLGFLYDSAETIQLEVSTSKDGKIWSNFQAIKTIHNEQTNGMTAATGVSATTQKKSFYYRLRSVSGLMPNHLKIEPLGKQKPAENVAPEFKVQSTERRKVGYPEHLEVTDRHAWDAAPAPRCQSKHTPRLMTIHHTVTPNRDSINAAARARQIQSYHQLIRGWCDLGYHFLIGQDGEIIEGRRVEKVGAHVGGKNTSNIGIAFLGDFRYEAPSAKSLAKAAALVDFLSEYFSIELTSNNLLGHRDYTNRTLCPGNELYAKIDELRSPSPTGRIVGIVYSKSPENRIPNLEIRLSNGVSTTTNRSGYYSFENLHPGPYRIIARFNQSILENSRYLEADETIWASFKF